MLMGSSWFRQGCTGYGVQPIDPVKDQKTISGNRQTLAFAA